MSIQEQLVALSHEFGTGDYVQGGGGNSSVKDGDTIWVKPSGTTLAGLQVGGLLEIERAKVARIYALTPPRMVAEREALITRMLGEAKKDSSDPHRPSVETPLHDSFAARFVMHTHPQLVCGMVCAQQSETVCRRLFPEHVYLPAADPGYMISMQIREAIARFRTRNGHEPTAVFMANHGLVVAGDSVEEIRAATRCIMDRLIATYKEQGISTDLPVAAMPENADVAKVVASVQQACGGDYTECSVASGAFKVAPDAISPDHVVYMKSYAFFGEPTEEALGAFTRQHGYSPRVVVTDRAVVCFGSTQRNAQLAMDLAKDGALVMQLAEAFGGIRYMSDEARTFIEQWEAEQYRQEIGATSSP